MKSTLVLRGGLVWMSVKGLWKESQLRIVEQAAGHLRWEVHYPPSQPVGSGFEPHWRPQPAKLPSFGVYSLETLPYLMKDKLAAPNATNNE